MYELVSQHVYNMKENADEKKWAYGRCLFCLGAGTAVAGSLGATRFPGWVEGAIGIGTSGTSAFGGGGGGGTGSSGGGGNAGGVRYGATMPWLCATPSAHCRSASKLRSSASTAYFAAVRLARTASASSSVRSTWEDLPVPIAARRSSVTGGLCTALWFTRETRDTSTHHARLTSSRGFWLSAPRRSQERTSVVTSYSLPGPEAWAARRAVRAPQPRHGSGAP